MVVACSMLWGRYLTFPYYIKCKVHISTCTPNFDMLYSSESDQRVIERARYRARREALIQSLGARCLICGFTRDRFEASRDPFQLHHLDHQFSTQDSRSISQAQLEKDARARKVVLLCSLCHRTISRVKYWKRLGQLETAMALAKI